MDSNKWVESIQTAGYNGVIKKVDFTYYVPIFQCAMTVKIIIYEQTKKSAGNLPFIVLSAMWYFNLVYFPYIRTLLKEASNLPSLPYRAVEVKALVLTLLILVT